MRSIDTKNWTWQARDNSESSYWAERYADMAADMLDSADWSVNNVSVLPWTHYCPVGLGKIAIKGEGCITVVTVDADADYDGERYVDRSKCVHVEVFRA